MMDNTQIRLTIGQIEAFISIVIVMPMFYTKTFDIKCASVWANENAFADSLRIIPFRKSFPTSFLWKESNLANRSLFILNPFWKPGSTGSPAASGWRMAGWGTTKLGVEDEDEDAAAAAAIKDGR